MQSIPDENTDTLPVSFWGAATDLNSTQVAPAVSAQDELAQWAPSFEVLGFDMQEALKACVDTHSDHLGKVMHTVEDVYRHLQMQAQSTIEAVTKAVTQNHPDSRPSQMKRVDIETAREEWHTAVQQRKEAVRQWDDYVASKRAAFVSARNRT